MENQNNNSGPFENAEHYDNIIARSFGISPQLMGIADPGCKFNPDDIAPGLTVLHNRFTQETFNIVNHISYISESDYRYDALDMGWLDLANNIHKFRFHGNQ